MNSEHNIKQAITYPAIATAALLMIPLIAMQFSNDVVWTLSDFIFAGIMIFGTGFTYKLVTGKSGNVAYRVAVGFALFTGFFLIWSNLAVGLIGSENNEFNLLYFLVIGVGVMGAFIARFKAIGLMITLLSMAATQAIIAIAALFSGMAEVPESSAYEILAVNGFFVTLFVVAAMLFRYAAEEQASENE
ncbi:MAG TPA: hypothetical protein VFM80_07705 [Gracilimonas sp.]|uniref:hypothetical protein n=1 Tax=Gracilimonas sp. TaxID=1974203 RepID=UPI002D847BF9|nr:hypothetical protein [Gracilimonas sp.]